jgi:hypothetical protein
VRYSHLLRTEAHALAVGIFIKTIKPSLLSSMKRPYDINGDVMERRTGDFELLHVLRDVIPSFPIENNESKSRLKLLSKNGDREKGAATGAGTGVNGGILDPASTEDSKKNSVSGVYEGEGNAPVKASSSIRELLATRMSSTARTEVRTLLLRYFNDEILFIAFILCCTVRHSDVL